MPADPTITLLDRLRQCELLESSQLEEIAAIPEAIDPDPRTLGRVLLRREWLTRFQIQEVARGRGKDLVIGPYILLDRLGEGGMGQVFKARHRHMKRIVALKLIKKDKLASEGAAERFYREARAAAQLHHPNIVVAYDAGLAGTTFYLAMEYVEGSDLARVVCESGPLPWTTAIDYVSQAARGLEHARERGLVHRDIKPSNLLLSRDPSGADVVKILDMGLARVQSLSGAEKALTQTGEVMGTPDYLAPEQALDARSADIRADLYSLGCTLYYLLTGRPPFSGESVAQVLLKHQMQEPETPPGGWEEFPAGVRGIVRKLLSKNPDERYQTPQKLIDALKTIREESAAPAVAKAVKPRPARTSSAARQTLAGSVADETPRSMPKSAPEKTAEVPDAAEGPRKLKEHPLTRLRRKRWLFFGVIFLGIVQSAMIVIGVAILLRRWARPPEPPPTELSGLTNLALPGLPPVGELDTGAPSSGMPSKSKTPAGGLPGKIGQASGTGKQSSDDAEIPPNYSVVSRLPRQSAPILGVAYSPDGMRLITTSRDGFWCLWDLSGAEPQKLFERDEKAGPLGSPAFSPDGRKLSLATREKVILCDLSDASPVSTTIASGALLSENSPFPEQLLGFSPGGRFLAAPLRRPIRVQNGTSRMAVNLWRIDATAPEIVSTTHHTGEAIHCLTVSATGLVATGRANRTVGTVAYDRSGLPHEGNATPPLSGGVIGIAYTPEATLMAATTKVGTVATFRDSKDGNTLEPALEETKGHNGWAQPLCFTPDGQYLLTRGEDRRVIWWNVAKGGGKFKDWELPGQLDIWRFSPDGQFAALDIQHDRIAIIRLPQPFQQP